jgi:hypothetical protein
MEGALAAGLATGGKHRNLRQGPGRSPEIGSNNPLLHASTVDEWEISRQHRHESSLMANEGGKQPRAEGDTG